MENFYSDYTTEELEVLKEIKEEKLKKAKKIEEDKFFGFFDIFKFGTLSRGFGVAKDCFMLPLNSEGSVGTRIFSAFAGIAMGLIICYAFPFLFVVGAVAAAFRAVFKGIFGNIFKAIRKGFNKNKRFKYQSELKTIEKELDKVN